MTARDDTAARLAQLHQVREQSLRELVDAALSAARQPVPDQDQPAGNPEAD